MEDDPMQLPPGFRFHPTDEELITHYLSPKAADHGFSARAVGEVDLNKCEPWDLPSKAKMGEKEWYFFCQRDRKYPTGTRTNRATEAGFWKATGKDKEIFKGRGILVGMKKTLVFYRGRAPRGEKTNWVMHEYRLDGSAFLPHLPRSAKEEWVVCRVLHKDAGGNGLSVEAATASTSSLRPGLIYPSYDSTAAAMRPSPSNRSGYYEIPPAAAGGSFSVLLGLENSSPVFFPQQAAAHPPPPPQPQLQRTNYYLSYLNNNVVEQCPSQETGLSTAEIESSLDEPASSAGPVDHLDLENIWKY